MEHCPTCGARHAGGPSCHRCRTDLSQVLAIERAAASHRRPARAALERGADGAHRLHRHFRRTLDQDVKIGSRKPVT